MPKVGNKKFPYTEEGKQDAKKAMMKKHTGKGGPMREPLTVGERMEEKEHNEREIQKRLIYAKIKKERSKINSLVPLPHDQAPKGRNI